MRIIPPSHEIIAMPDGTGLVRTIELAGRTCYKSEDKITDDSAERFVKMIIKSGHESVIEHSSASVRFICDRGVTHELVRHRIAAFSQESTRYCNYSKDKFGDEITVIRPLFFEQESPAYARWEQAMQEAETAYMELLEAGAKPEEARSVLPNSLKTEIVMTANLREWRHVFRLRCARRAHPQIREIMLPLLAEMHERIPAVFDDLYEQFAEDIASLEHRRIERDGQ
jgi:thymidylate synthase (FAD)